ncbi:flagellar brake protein [Pseudoalteromonas sp. MMG010]|uniref:flagellar brake protein n=1 Tax=Pseudoalteromonas sp. MMG010 TaxID=2822685 RepID=UPI001B3A30BE|nr:flagellar brake protein [Pseudoalteromonas sp. MMG010]MBQ4834585.1 flagellar brake protein [Pseudoalteromonas sp. MMG010]
MPQSNIDKLGQLACGSVIDLEIMTPTNSKRVKTEFVGFLQDKFIILNYPNAKKMPGASDYIHDGVMVVVRGLVEGQGGQVIAFRQQILAVTSHPTKLIFVGMPNKVEIFSLRSQTRIPTLFPANLKLADDRIIEGIIKDISLTGIMFDTKSNIKSTDLKDMACSIILEKTSKGTHTFVGEICSAKKHKHGIYCGIKLLASETQMQAFMKDHFIDVSVLK